MSDENRFCLGHLEEKKSSYFAANVGVISLVNQQSKTPSFLWSKAKIVNLVFYFHFRWIIRLQCLSFVT